MTISLRVTAVIPSQSATICRKVTSYQVTCAITLPYPQALDNHKFGRASVK